jgi:guanylate kinase
MNELKHLQDFKKVLSGYQASIESQEVLASTRLVLLTAPSAGGRNTLINELLKTDEYYFIISDTTRQPRINNGVLEQHGTEYFFRTEADFLQDLQDGKFLEAEVIHNQQVSGISIRELNKARTANKVAITDVDIGGIQSILQAKPDTVAIIVLPPSFKEWQRRFHGRTTMHPEEYKRRMATAVRIFAAALEDSRFTFVLNDTIEHAVEQVHRLAVLDEVEPGSQERYRALAEQLFKQATELLESL